MMYSTTQIITDYRPRYDDIWHNNLLFTAFNIRCDPDFLDNSIKSSLVQYFVYKFKNPNDLFIGMISNLNDGSQIAEMLNGDSIGQAADTVGSSHSVSDIFKKILDKNWAAYHRNMKIERYINEVENYISKLSFGENVSTKQLTSISKNLTKPGPFKFITENVNQASENISTLISEVTTNNNELKTKNGLALQRVKDNLKEGTCPITCDPLSESKSIVVLVCCGIAISIEGISIFDVKKGFNCPNCRAQVKSEGIIKMDRNINLDNILDDDEDEEEIEVTEDIDQEIQMTEKVKCIINIILGQTDKLKNNQVDSTGMIIEGLLEGKQDCGYAESKDIKTLIYGSFIEGMTSIREALENMKIPYAKLQGTFGEISKIHHRYKLPNDHPDSINVLLITGPKYCAGLDLQNSTDLIFTHRVMNQDITRQIAGRCVRHGRKKNLRIHYVLYNNEV